MNRVEAIITLTNTASLLRDGTRYMKLEHEKQFREAYEMAIKALEQPEQRWIPCTPDTMPSENDAYIVTCVVEDIKWTDVAEYSKRHKGWRYGLYSDNIIAWMPLPEPYGGEQE